MTDKSGPAFPTTPNTQPGFYQHHGISKRDYFAAAALTGILAGGYADTIPHDDINGGSDAAFFAYQYADAMLTAGGHDDG